jgi:alpha-1,3-rhamnosyl/mannosyltransferase
MSRFVASVEMRIGIETTSLRGPRTGIGEYVYRLVEALLPLLLDQDTLHGYDGLRCLPIESDYLEYAAKQNELLARSSTNTNIGVGRSAYLFFRQAPMARQAAQAVKELTFKMAEKKFDIFHATNFAPPGPFHKPVLPLVYDLSFIRYPELHPIERVQWLERQLPTIVKSPFIQTISNFCKQEITQLLGVPGGQIYVSYPGIASHFTPQRLDTDDAYLAKIRVVPKRYFLIVATREPRKNFTTAAEAYVTLPNSLRSVFPLIWVGASGWGDLKLGRAVEKARDDGQIRFTGYLPEAALAALYRHTSLFIMPSLYEGFGMPVAEALACKSPIAVSDIPVFREVAGPRASYISAMDVSGWHEVMYAASEGRPIISPHTLTDSERFSWTKAATQSLELYRRLFVQC